MSTTTTATKAPAKVRYFAHSDCGLENGSFRRITFRPAWARGDATYINGDYMGSDIVDAGRLNTVCEDLRTGGYVEYAPKDFKRLAPKCCGGKGRL